MIPRQMQAYLRDHLPEQTWQNRLQSVGDMRFMEFGPLDVDRLARLGIEVDRLGPWLVVCMWDERPDLEVGGYLVVDNLAMGRPSMGGIRKLPDLTPAMIHNLARGMTLKNAAADLPYGGGKAGIVADRNLSRNTHQEIVRNFARLLYRYHDVYLPGPDVGTDDSDMALVAIENGIDNALSKPADMGGNRIDQLGAAAGGVIIALRSLLEEMPSLRSLPQFQNLEIPAPQDLTLLIQGFGAVGAHAARILQRDLPESRVLGVSDASGYLFNENGLPIHELFATWKKKGLVCRPTFLGQASLQPSRAPEFKFSTDPNDLLRETAFCLVPAAPIANYLDTDPATKPSMTVDRMGQWALIIEGANTYSPDQQRKLARARMERAVYRQKGVLIVTDYLVNSGGVIYAAQEHLIKTPDHLRFPEDILGDEELVRHWLQQHSGELETLAEERLEAAKAYRDSVIRRNMHELTELLLTDPDMLPCEAAERISVRRIASSERHRTAADIMAPIPTVDQSGSVQQAAQELLQSDSSILAVVSAQGALVGVVTEWDLTRAVAQGCKENMPVEDIMSKDVISAARDDSILEIIRMLEHHEISAMPVVDKQEALGMISADLLARRSLLQLLQSQEDG